MSSRMNDYFSEYDKYHKTKGNKVTHYFGIPFIVFSLLGLLGSLSLSQENSSIYFRLDGGVILLVAAFFFYLWVDRKIVAPFMLVLIGFYFLGRAIPTAWNLGFFVTGWILQGIGHAAFEKKSPAFFKNFTHILIGPLWIFARLIGF